MGDFNQNKLKDILNQMIRENKMAPKLHEAKIKDQWASLMGPMVDTYTEDISLKKNVLYIRILSAPLKNELMMGKELLIRNINKVIGASYVKDIVFR